MEKRLSLIDSVKLFFAFCIVGIHTEILEEFPEPINWYITHLIFRMGVPFFFMVSGYFFGRKFLIVADSRKDRMIVCKKYVKNLLPSFMFWGAIGLLWYVITLIRLQDNQIVLKVIRTAIFYPRGAMWYISASMIAVMIIGCLWDHKKMLILLGVGGVLLCLDM